MAAKRFRRSTGATGPRHSRQGLQNKPVNSQIETRKALQAVDGKGHGKPLGLQPKQHRSYILDTASHRYRALVTPRKTNDACSRAELAKAKRHLGITT